MRQTIEGILKEYSESEANLSSASARQVIADTIIKKCLSKGKSLLIDENKALKKEIAELRETLDTVLKNLDS